MSLVLILLLATSYSKALISGEAFESQMKLARKEWIKLREVGKTPKKELTEKMLRRSKTKLLHLESGWKIDME